MSDPSIINLSGSHDPIPVTIVKDSNDEGSLNEVDSSPKKVVDMTRESKSSRGACEILQIVILNVGRVFLAVIGGAGAAAIVMGACHFHLPFWAVYAGGGVLGGSLGLLILSLIPWKKCIGLCKTESKFRGPLFTDDTEEQWKNGVRPSNLFPGRQIVTDEKIITVKPEKEYDWQSSAEEEEEVIRTDREETKAEYIDRNKKVGESDKDCLARLRGEASKESPDDVKNKVLDLIFEHSDLQTQVALLSIAKKRETEFGTQTEDERYTEKCEELNIEIPDGVSPKERYIEARGFPRNVKNVDPIVTTIEEKDAVFPLNGIEEPYDGLDKDAHEILQAVDGNHRLIMTGAPKARKRLLIVDENGEQIKEVRVSDSNKNWTCGDLRSKLIIAGRRDGVVEIIQWKSGSSVKEIKVGSTPILAVSLRGHVLTVKTADGIKTYNYMPGSGEKK